MNARLRQLGIAGIVAAAAAGAAAQSSPYYIGASVAYSHESNPLGLTENADVPSGYVSKSDNVASIALIGGLDQTIGRQRVFGDLTLRENRYERNKVLNHRSHSLTAGLDWQTVERVSGKVLLRSNEDLVRFTSFERPTGERNLVESQLAEASVRLGSGTRYSFDAGAGYRSVEYSDASYDSRDYRQNNLFVGARYTPSGQNWAAVSLRGAEGRYPRLVQAGTGVVGERFDRRDLQLSFNLQGAGVNSVYVQGAYSKIDYQLQDRLDFSGFTGLLRGTWMPTAKLQLWAELARDRGQDIAFALDAFGGRLESAKLASAARLRLAFEASAKVELHSNAIFTRRSVIESRPIFGIEDAGRERGMQLGIGASWTPTRTSRIGCDWTREQRRADIAAELLNVTSNSASCFAQLTLQP